MNREDAQNYLEKANPDFLMALHELSESSDFRQLPLSDAMAVVFAYFDFELNAEDFSKETQRQIRFLQRRWSEDAVLWRCVERAYQQVMDEQD